MPTFEQPPRFRREYKRLSPANKELFKAEVLEWVKYLRQHGIDPTDPRVNGVEGAPGIFEFRWAANGRATFSWGMEKIRGEPHVMWRRVGTHVILKEP